MSFVLLNTVHDVAKLPDGTLITWLPVADDPSSEACAFVRKSLPEPDQQVPDTMYTPHRWISPGNGWEPEPLSVIVFPARVVLLGVPAPGDFVPPEYLTSTDEDDLADANGPQWFEAVTGGTYPRDVALQAVATVYQGIDFDGIGLSRDEIARYITKVAEHFAEWLMPVTAISQDQIARSGPGPGENNDGTDQIAPLSLGPNDV